MGKGKKSGHRLDKKKSVLLSGLVEVRASILDEARRIKPEDEERAFIGEWSINDLLAHIAGWDKTNLAAAREILQGEVPSFYAHYDKGWASYNAELVKTYKRGSLEAMIELVESTHRELVEYLEDLSPEDLFEDRGIRASGYKVTIGRLLDVERTDEEEHLAQIRSFISSL
ncbi:MAG: ClbS/DfsB family four-helix bundle protein [Anaerolineales bacterium]|nr:ClbS/DfsB family four-helix bundle protein [Anaerolineales bacterium]